MKWFRMKEVIDSVYGWSEDLVRCVSRTSSEEGKTIYKARNEIKVLEIDGVELSVKRYRVPLLINRVIHRFFRQPKVVRAYEYAPRSVAKGLETSALIVYILFRKKGFLGYSYFISLQFSYKTLYKVGQRPVEGNEDVFRALGTYMAESHETEVYHADFFPGNVSYDHAEEGVRSSLIDVNRMHFGPVLLKRGCVNFSRLWGREAAFHLMVETCAESRHLDKVECLRWILYYRNRLWKKYTSKHEIEFEL